MRFIENGPILPDELLFAHDEEQVVFFCGSGVSAARVRLPNFNGLAEAVLDRLGAADDNDARRLFNKARELDADPSMRGISSADRVFGLLARSFKPADINRAVAGALRPPENPDLSAHKILLRLGRLRGGQTRIITTNFDRLFEACDRRLACSTRSNLPRIQFTDNDWGIVHLHGCVMPDYSGPTGDGFVLSSAEFGNAYLAHGWARDFIRDVLDQYTAVFVGYSADDPPMRYLLEGLREAGGHKHRIYALQDASDYGALAQWNDKGVEPITYAVSPSTGHEMLWQTLSAWTQRAQNHATWRKKIFAMGRNGPAKLLPHERGMIAHLVRSNIGAIAFSRNEPPLPAEWLCVFDRGIRYSTPAPNFQALQGPIVDPYSRYALDDDPAPSNRAGGLVVEREMPRDAWDAFAINTQDKKLQGDNQLSAVRGHWARNISRLSPRLDALGVWVARVAHEPACAWWAARQGGLHPDIERAVQSTIFRPQSTVSKAVRDAWKVIFQIADFGQDDLGHYDLTIEIAAAGWSPATVRQYAACFAPYLQRESFRAPNVPPLQSKKLTRQDIVRIDVKYPELHDVAVPDEYLASVIDHQRANLETAVDFTMEYGGWLEIDSIDVEPQQEGENLNRGYDLSGYALHFADLFKRLADFNPAAAKSEFTKWRRSDSLFQRLRIWAARYPAIAPADKFSEFIDTLDDQAFWPFKGERDFLLVLASRWTELDARGREKIEQKILAGSPKSRRTKKLDHIERSAHWQLTRFHWLASQGCALTFDLAALTEKLRKKAPRWKPEYAAHAVESRDPRSGWIKTDTDWSALASVPVSEILDRAEKSGGRKYEEFTEQAPFTGLSADDPLRAISALSFTAKRGQFKANFWESFLSHAKRAEDKLRLKALIAGRLVQLPDDALRQILLSASSWFLAAGADIRSIAGRTANGGNSDIFDRLWTRFTTLIQTQPDSAGSTLVRQRGEIDWTTESINAPAGNLAQLLMNDPAKEHLEKGAGVPLLWRAKAEGLLALPGDSSRYALVIFAFNLSWFDYIDPDWTATHLLNCLGAPDEESPDADALWSGFMWGNRTPHPALYVRLKPYLLELARSRSSRGRRHGEVLSIVLLSGWKSRDAGGNRFVSNAEMRGLLLDTDDEFRSYLIWQLERWTKDEQDEWKADLIEFLSEVWPKHSKIRTAKMSARLCDLAIAQGENFPAVSKLVIQLVSVVDDPHVFIKEISTREDTVSSRYPKDMLDLLYAVLHENPASWPYGAREALSRIEKANSALLKNPKLIELKSRLNEP